MSVTEREREMRKPSASWVVLPDAGFLLSATLGYVPCR